MKVDITRTRAYRRLAYGDREAAQRNMGYVLAQCAQIGVDPARLKRAPFVKDPSGAPFHGMTKAELDAALVTALSTEDLRAVATARLTPPPDPSGLKELAATWLRPDDQDSLARDLSHTRSNIESLRRNLRVALQRQYEQEQQLLLLQLSSGSHAVEDGASALAAALAAVAEHPFWALAQVRSGGLVWRTRGSVIVLDIDGTPYDVGMWWMYLEPPGCALRFAPVPGFDGETLRHPHVYTGSEALCYGTGKEAVASVLVQLTGLNPVTVGSALRTLLDTIAGLLCSYDSSSCYTKLPDCIIPQRAPSPHWAPASAGAAEAPEPGTLGERQDEVDDDDDDEAPVRAGVQLTEVETLAWLESLHFGSTSRSAEWLLGVTVPSSYQRAYPGQLAELDRVLRERTYGVMHLAQVGAAPRQTYILSGFEFTRWEDPGRLTIAPTWSLNVILDEAELDRLRERVRATASGAQGDMP